MQHCNDTSLFRGLWNDHISLSCSSQTERKSSFLHLPPLQSPALFWLHAYNPLAARWAHSMAHYSLQYFFSVLVNSQGRSQNWKGLFVPQGQIHVITGAAPQQAPRLMDSTAFHPEKSQRECPHIFHTQPLFISPSSRPFGVVYLFWNMVNSER